MKLQKPKNFFSFHWYGINRKNNMSDVECGWKNYWKLMRNDFFS